MTAHFHDIPADAKEVSALRVKTTKAGFYARYAKRAIDVGLILLTAPITVPVIALMALLTALDGSNPFYMQRRVGVGGRRFTLVKIRTMVPDADNLLKQFLESDADAKAEWDATQKLRRDPRVTLAGRILRKTSLDELPQLWNVLVGDMSLVGPRPMMEDQEPMYPGTAYYTVRPGITGPWQVSARNACEFKGRAKYDALYANSVSLRTDVALLARTVTTVLRGTGY